MGALAATVLTAAGAFALASLRHDIPALWHAAQRICVELICEESNDG